MRGPAPADGVVIGGIQEIEGEELGDERVFDGEQECGPREGWSDYPKYIAAVGLNSAVFGKF